MFKNNQQSKKVNEWPIDFGLNFEKNRKSGKNK